MNVHILSVLKVALFFFQEFFLGCEAGFDGGHTPRYHIEVYEVAVAAGAAAAGGEGTSSSSRNRLRRRFHLAHNITRSVPSFHVHQLKPLTDYAVVAYASNSLGRQVGEISRAFASCPAQSGGVTHCKCSCPVFSTVLPDCD